MANSGRTSAKPIATRAVRRERVRFHKTVPATVRTAYATVERNVSVVGVGSTSA
jgi:hypothetical protein